MLPIYCEQWHKWFFWRKKRRLEWKKKKTILSWCVMFNFQKKDMFKWKQKHIYSCVNLFFLPINYLASYLYNFICLIKKPHQIVKPATLLLLLLYYKYNSKVNVACSKKIEKNFRLLILKIFHCLVYYAHPTLV